MAAKVILFPQPAIIGFWLKSRKIQKRKQPFIGFELSEVRKMPKCLETEEFEFLKAFLPKRETSIRGESMFQYYAYGMRVSDLLLLKRGDIYEPSTC